MKWMPLGEIKVDNPYLRTDTDIESLKRSIETVGLINPVTVNDRGELLAGGRRYSAVKALGWTEVPANVVDRSKLEQELVSIDENLVRKPLDGLELEQSLNRGREIYEMLNPEAKRVELDPIPEVVVDRSGEDDEDDNSFAAVTARKTGLTKKAIQSAIRRDALSSDQVKLARRHIGASRTNELIKLEHDTQDQLLPYVRDLPVKAVKQVVRAAHEEGLDSAIARSEELLPPPKAYLDLAQLSRRLRKTVTRIITEGLTCDPDHKDPIDEDVRALAEELQDYLSMPAPEAAEAQEPVDEEPEEETAPPVPEQATLGILDAGGEETE